MLFSFFAEEPLFDIFVDAGEPGLGALRTLLGALGAVLVVAQIDFELLDPYFGGAQSNGGLVRIFRSAVAIGVRAIGRLLQERDNGLSTVLLSGCTSR